MKQQSMPKIDKNRELTFLLVGRSGVGKSSSINSLLNQQVAETNAFEPQTQEVTGYENEVHGIKYRVYDTPGLEDVLDDENRSINILKEIQNKIPKVDCLFFVTPLDETRIRSDEQKSIKLISQIFGRNVWEHSVIVFTFANNKLPDTLSNSLEKRTSLIRKEILKYAFGLTEDIPSVAIDNSSAHVNGKTWLSELYLTVFNRISSTGKIPFIMITMEAIKSGDIPLSSEQKKGIAEDLEKNVGKKVDFWDTLKAIGFLLGIAIIGIIVENSSDSSKKLPPVGQYPRYIYSDISTAEKYMRDTESQRK